MYSASNAANQVYLQDHQNPDCLLSLLHAQKDKVECLRRLKAMVFKLNWYDVAVKRYYLMIVPMFLSFAELSEQDLICGRDIVTEMLKNPLFINNYRLDLERWLARLDRLVDRVYNNQKKRRLNFTYNVTELDKPMCYGDLELYTAFHRWLRFNKFHKYLFYFGNLSYWQVLSITDAHRAASMERVINLIQVSNGGRRKIVNMVQELKSRSNTLRNIIYQTGYFQGPQNVTNAIYLVRKVLLTPIPSYYYKAEIELIDMIVVSLRNVSMYVYMTMHNEDNFVKTVRILQQAYSCTFFSKDHKQCFNYFQKQLVTKNNNENYSFPSSTVDRDTPASSYNGRINLTYGARAVCRVQSYLDSRFPSIRAIMFQVGPNRSHHDITSNQFASDSNVMAAVTENTARPTTNTQNGPSTNFNLSICSAPVSSRIVPRNVLCLQSPIIASNSFDVPTDASTQWSSSFNGQYSLFGNKSLDPSISMDTIIQPNRNVNSLRVTLSITEDSKKQSHHFAADPPVAVGDLNKPQKTREE